jgi:hypothetical protein
VDDRIVRLSQAAEVDLTPLIHFWGVHPQDPAALAMTIADNNLPPSPLICERLMHYRSIIPMDNEQFNEHAVDFFNGPVPPGGNPDYGNGWYNVWLPLYNTSHGDSAVIAMQNIIDLYFPNGCAATNVPEVIIDENYVSVFPNPNSGQFTISIPDGNAEITVTDILGQQILKTTATQKTINLQLNKNGVYNIEVKTMQVTTTKRVIVNH